MEREKQKELTEKVCRIAYDAGKEILKVYDSEFAIEHKDDKSPLTEADKQSHLAIERGLQQLEYPILSEEGRDIAYEERSSWDYFWMVDPLDGTKEFIKRNGEFTVNIALIHQQQSILGVIYVPVKDELYFGINGVGSFKIQAFSEKTDQSVDEWMVEQNQLPQVFERPYTIVGSRSHMSPETEEFIEEMKGKHGEIDIISVGSSLKLCMVAEGKADAYPRFAPTMEWDTAAGQAIVEAMGRSVIDWKTKENMKYNRENLLNNWFLVN